MLNPMSGLWKYSVTRHLPFSPVFCIIRTMTDWMRMSVTCTYRKGIAAFGGVAPTYRIELRERPTIVWDFNSLLLCVQMMFSFMLTDDNSSLKVCKHCGKAFVAARPNMEFCSSQCKNQYNVYKSRAKKNDTTDVE